MIVLTLISGMRRKESLRCDLISGKMSLGCEVHREEDEHPHDDSILHAHGEADTEGRSEYVDRKFRGRPNMGTWIESELAEG